MCINLFSLNASYIENSPIRNLATAAKVLVLDFFQTHITLSLCAFSMSGPFSRLPINNALMWWCVNLGFFLFASHILRRSVISKLCWMVFLIRFILSSPRGFWAGLWWHWSPISWACLCMCVILTRCSRVQNVKF